MKGAVFLFLCRLFYGKGVNAMLVRLYAGEYVLGKITLDQVPVKLRDDVAAYLADMGVEA